MATKLGTVSRDRAILNAAAELFFERGFGATGVDAIGRRAGVTGPAIYSHFNGKDEILATLALEELDRLFVRLGTPLEDPQADLEHLIRTHADVILTDRKLANVYLREGRSIGPQYRNLIDRRLNRYFTRWVDTLQRCYPRVDRARLTSVANGAMGIAHSIVLWRDDAFATPDLPDLIATMTRAAIAVLDG